MEFFSRRQKRREGDNITGNMLIGRAGRSTRLKPWQHLCGYACSSLPFGKYRKNTGKEHVLASDSPLAGDAKKRGSVWIVHTKMTQRKAGMKLTPAFANTVVS